jgi:hypothetical protein
MYNFSYLMYMRQFSSSWKKTRIGGVMVSVLGSSAVDRSNQTKDYKIVEKSVTFTGACANEIIPSIHHSFVYKAKEGGHVRIYYPYHGKVIIWQEMMTILVIY